jgi:hypothetical protein
VESEEEFLNFVNGATISDNNNNNDDDDLVDLDDIVTETPTDLPRYNRATELALNRHEDDYKPGSKKSKKDPD